MKAMAESKDSHIVEIPVDSEDEQKKLIPVVSNIAEAIEDHPLTEISESPGHLLLLKLWQREEEIFGRRIAHKELRMDSIKRDLFQLSSSFFIFHFLFFTLGRRIVRKMVDPVGDIRSNVGGVYNFGSGEGERVLENVEGGEEREGSKSRSEEVRSGAEDEGGELRSVERTESEWRKENEELERGDQVEAMELLL